VIVACKLQTSGSYHLDLQGTTGKTTIANSVDPRFVDPSSRWTKEIAAVRKEVETKLNPGPTYTAGVVGYASAALGSSIKSTDNRVWHPTALS
jgi:hypothetical protein